MMKKEAILEKDFLKGIDLYLVFFTPNYMNEITFEFLIKKHNKFLKRVFLYRSLKYTWLMKFSSCLKLVKGKKISRKLHFIQNLY